MIILVTKGSDYAFIDNEGEVLHNVRIAGNNSDLVDSLDRIINEQTAIRFQGELEGIPSELVVRDGDKPAEINKASDLYISKYFIKDLELQGFKVEITKE